MLKTICCCFCIRRKSKVSIAPNNQNSTSFGGDTKSGRILVQTAPGRFVSVTIMASCNPETITRPNSNLRPQRNGGPTRSNTDGPVGGSREEGKKIVDDRRMTVGAATDSDVDSTTDCPENGQTVLVVVDVERPKTSDTISSRISLPPLRSGSPASVVLGGKIKRVKWNLRRRGASEPRNLAEEPRLPKSVSASSIATSLGGTTDAEEPPVGGGVAKELKAVVAGVPVRSTTSQESWKDEIITLPGTAESDQPSEWAAVDGGIAVGSAGVPIASVPANMVLFFIHGVGGNCAIWDGQMRFFRELGYTVIAIDLIGHGNSSTPGAKSAYTFESIKTDVLAIFDRFARERNVVIAHSYGTCFAAVLGRERRDKVSHLVLISSGAPVPLDSDDGAFALPTPVLTVLRPALDRKFSKLAFVSKPSSSDLDASFGVRTGVLKRTMQGQRWADCNFLYHQQIHSPTLLVYGSSDGLVSLDEMHEMRKAIPGSVLEVVDQAAHMVMLEQPAHVNRLIEEFLRKTADRGGREGRREEEEREEDLDEERSRTEMGFYRDKRQRPPTATSRTIPPANVFKMGHGHHENAGGAVVRTVAVS